MGIVYEGKQKSLNRYVAVKKSKSEQKYLAQIYHEAQITAFLDHPNILPVYDFAVDQDGHAIQIMKKIDGISWSKLLYQNDHPFWKELDIKPDHHSRLLFHLEILKKVSQAIAYAHDKNVIHRDLKPANVMIGKFGEVFVLDWGIAIYIGQEAKAQFVAQVYANLEKSLVGTPGYMAPELADPQGSCKQSAATDVYLLAAILYEITHQKILHRGRDVKEILDKIKNNYIPTLAPDLSYELKNLLLSSLSSNPEHRPHNAMMFRNALQQVISSFKSVELEFKGISSLNALKDLIQNEEQAIQKSKIDHIWLNEADQKTEDLISFHFDEARHYFRSSLEYYQHNEEAQKAFQELISLWIERCIEKHDFKSAQRYLKESIYAKELEVKILNAKQAFEQEQVEFEKLKKWKEDQSFQNSQKPRIYLALFSLVFLGGVSLILYYLSSKGIYQDSAKGRFWAVFIFGFIVILLSELWFKYNAQKEQLNDAFKKVKTSIYCVLLSIMLARYLGWQYHNDYKIVLLHEMPMIILGSLIVSTNTERKDFFWGAMVFLAISLFSLIYSEQVALLYALAQFNLWLTVSIFWFKDQRAQE